MPGGLGCLVRASILEIIRVTKGEPSLSNSLRADLAKLTAYVGIQFARSAKTCLDRFERLPRFAFSLSSQHSIIEVFPDIGMFFQVCDDRHLVALLVDNKLDSA